MSEYTLDDVRREIEDVAHHAVGDCHLCSYKSPDYTDCEYDPADALFSRFTAQADTIAALTEVARAADPDCAALNDGRFSRQCSLRCTRSGAVCEALANPAVQAVLTEEER